MPDPAAARPGPPADTTLGAAASPILPRVVDHPSRHRSSRDGAPILAVVIHATAGTNSLAWLTRNPNGVSAHALIAKDGTLYRMVPDDDAAHHCAFSRIVAAGGRVYAANTRPGPNQITLGVEIENRNDGADPYPDAQLNTLGWLLADWVRRYNPLLVRHADIDTRGKTDPRGLSWQRIYAALGRWLAPAPAEPPAVGYTADSLVIQPTPLPLGALGPALARRCAGGHYDAATVQALAATYEALEREVGVCAVLAAAQMCHETGNLTSARSAPPRHNLAGIGATGDGVPGLAFPDLTTAARAQVGRLVAYALPPPRRTVPQQALATEALMWRPLPAACQGSGPTLRLLGAEPNAVGGCGWASPGTEYGAAIARIANALLREAV